MIAGALLLLAGACAMAAEVWMAATRPALAVLSVVLFPLTAFTEYVVFTTWRHDLAHVHRQLRSKRRSRKHLRKELAPSWPPRPGPPLPASSQIIEPRLATPRPRASVGCAHENAVPVESVVTDEILAALCPICGERLPPEFLNCRHQNAIDTPGLGERPGQQICNDCGTSGWYGSKPKLVVTMPKATSEEAEAFAEIWRDLPRLKHATIYMEGDR